MSDSQIFDEDEVMVAISQQEDDDKSVEALISAVKTRPVLYDLRDDSYRNINLKKTAWEGVALGVGKPSEWCKTEWVKRRAAYMRKKKSVRGTTGQARKKAMKDPFFLQMMFLDDSLAGGRRTSNFTRSQVDLNSAEGDSAANSDGEEDHPPGLPVTPSSDKGLGVREQTYSNNRNKERKPDAFEREVIKYMNKDDEGLHDEHFHYGQSLAEKLRKLEPKEAAYLKLKIDEVVYETMYGGNNE